MGGGGTLVEGIRRLFQRRASTSAETHNNANNSRVHVRDLRAQLSSIPSHDLLVDPDFDFSTLKPIKVPAQIPFRPSSMDHHKKVLFFIAPSPLFSYCHLFSRAFSFSVSLILLGTAQVSFFIFSNPLLYLLL